MLLGISLAEFIYGAVYFPWNGGGTTTAASTTAAAWAFGAIVFLLHRTTRSPERTP